ncbi:MAG: TonB-dependent receptor [Rhodospirillaceae bacterium]|nr:TonB-dependent receptor [Rhodospirillaceae bacterium]
MSYPKNMLKSALLLTTVLCVAATGAAAQQLEEIVVTARKRSENLQDIPLTVTAFTSQMIERQNIRNVQDVVKFTPGLNYDKGFAPQDTRISIRGLPVVRGKPPVGVLLDGIDISSESLSTAGGSSLVNVKLVDLESIAVVKGPQSALYGRSAFGGAVVYSSKKPNLEQVDGSASLDGATYGSFEARGAVSVPIVDDRFAVRLNAVYSYFDGFHRNTITNNKIGGDKFVGGALALRFKPSESTDFTFRTSYSDDKSEARPSYYTGVANGLAVTRPVPPAAIGVRLGAPTAPIQTATTWPFARTGKIDVTGIPIRLSVDPLTGKDFVGGRLRPVVNSLVGQVDFGEVTLSSWTGYTTARSYGRTDADFYAAIPTNVTLPTAGLAEPLPGMFITDINVKANQFSQEFRLGQDSGALKWSVGGLYWKEGYKSDNASLAVGVIGRPVGFSAARAHQIAGRQPASRNARFTKHTSGYATLSYDLTEQFEASVEARYAHEKVDSILGQALNLIVAGPIASYAFGAVPINPTPTYTTNMFTPRAVLKYNIDDDSNVYVSFSKGMKPGGYLNVAVVTDSKLARYNPEKIYNYEAGFKTAWMDNRVRFNGSYFHADNKNRLNQVLIPDPTSPQGVATQAVNIGAVKIDGAELEFTAAISEEVTGMLAYTYLDPRYTDSAAPQTSAFAAAAAGNCQISTVGPQTVCITNTNGNQLDFSAKHSLSGSLNYVTPLTADWNLNSSVDVQMRSHRFLDATNLYDLPSYWNVDLRIGAESDKYSVTLYATNLFDNDKPKSGQTAGDTYSLTPPQLVFTAYAPDKRQVGLRLTSKF